MPCGVGGGLGGRAVLVAERERPARGPLPRRLQVLPRLAQLLVRGAGGAAGRALAGHRHSLVRRQRFGRRRRRFLRPVAGSAKRLSGREPPPLPRPRGLRPSGRSEEAAHQGQSDRGDPGPAGGRPVRRVDRAGPHQQQPGDDRRGRFPALPGADDALPQRQPADVPGGPASAGAPAAGLPVRGAHARGGAVRGDLPGHAQPVRAVADWQRRAAPRRCLQTPALPGLPVPSGQRGDGGGRGAAAGGRAPALARRQPQHAGAPAAHGAARRPPRRLRVHLGHTPRLRLRLRRPVPLGQGGQDVAHGLLRRRLRLLRLPQGVARGNL